MTSELYGGPHDGGRVMGPGKIPHLIYTPSAPMPGGDTVAWSDKPTERRPVEYKRQGGAWVHVGNALKRKGAK